MLRMRRGQICPDKVVVPLRYSQITTLALGSSFCNVYAQNGVTDCDYSVPGDQSAIGLQQWLQFYERYRVLATHFRVTVINADPNNNPVAFSIAAGADFFLSSTTAVEVSQLKFAPTRDLIWVAAGTPPRTKALKVNTSELLGERQYDEEDLFGTSTNPTKMLYLYFAATAFGAGSPPAASVQLAVEIEYMVEFSQSISQFAPVVPLASSPHAPSFAAGPAKADPAGVLYPIMLPPAADEMSAAESLSRPPRALVVQGAGSTCKCERCVT